MYTLLQTLPQTNLKDDWIVIAAAMIVISLQAWSIKNTNWLRLRVTEITTYMFGAGPSAGGLAKDITNLQDAHHRHSNKLNSVDSAVQLVQKDVTHIADRISHIERVIDRRRGEVALFDSKPTDP